MLPIGGLLALLLCCLMFLDTIALPFSFPGLRTEVLFPIKSIKIKQESKEDETFGKLKLCPPGGRSFFEALQIACPMRKRRKRSVTFEELWSAIDSEHHNPYNYRPASPDELMQICCSHGCELMDFLPYCGPF